MRSKGLGLVPVLLLSAAWASPCPAAVVRTVQFEQKPGFEPYDLSGKVAIAPGDDYSSGLVERSRRLLETTGLFRRVEVESEEREDGWRVTFRVVPYELVERIGISGNFLVLKKDLSRVLRLRVGDPFSEEKARQEASALLKVYEDRGFWQTQIRTEIDRGARGISVTYRVREGKPEVVRSIGFEGNRSFSAEELSPLLRVYLHGFFRQDQLVESEERLENFYRQKGFYEVDVTAGVSRPGGVVAPVISIVDPLKSLAALLPGQYEVVDVSFTVEEGQRHLVEVRGNEKFPAEELLSRLTFSRTGFFDEHEAETGRRSILDFYRREGFFLAEVGLEFDAGGRKATYSVREGSRFTVDSLDIEGLTFFGEGEIRSSLETWRSDGGDRRLLRADELGRDTEEIKDRYRSEGFLEVEVPPPRVVLDESSGKAKVIFEVREGTRFLVGSIIFEGLEAGEEEVLRGELRSREGLPYLPRLVTRDKEKILARVSAEGYPDCHVRERVAHVGAGLVELHYMVERGRRRLVGEVVVVGNRKTRDYVVLREFPLASGDPYSLGALVEGKRNLYGLGFFQEVQVQAPDPVDAESPQDIVIRVRERATGVFRVGVGYNSEDLYGGFAELGAQNLFGTGRGVSLRAAVSVRRRRYDFFFRESWPFGYPVNGEANIYEEFQERDAYDTVRRGAAVGAKKEVLDHLTLTLRYRFEFVDYENVDFAFGDNGETIEEIQDLESVNISSVVTILGYDLRDDPMNPRRGSYHSLSVELASPLLGGDTAFNKYVFQTSWYLPFRERSLLALGVRGGFAQPLGGFDQLPQSERFFLGGARGVRGYEEDHVGPRDAAGSPIGGDTFALGIAEFRFPLWKKSWFGVVFCDVGNVWAELSGIEPQAAKASVGAGIRYNTIVGPIRLDYGFKLNPDPGDSPGRLHFNIGFPI